MPIQKNTLQLPESELLSECVRTLREGRTVLLTARGSSMYPFIHDRDRVCLSSEGGFRKGDIVLLHPRHCRKGCEHHAWRKDNIVFLRSGKGKGAAVDDAFPVQKNYPESDAGL